MVMMQYLYPCRLQQIVGPGPVIQLEPLGVQPEDKDAEGEEEGTKDVIQRQDSAQPAKRNKFDNGVAADLVANTLQGNETLFSKQVRTVFL